MSDVFVEPRPKGNRDGSPITDYVVEDHADHVLATRNTRFEAIQWARPRPHAHLAPCPASERQSKAGSLANSLGKQRRTAVGELHVGAALRPQ
jgi:hypothetical protein